MQPYQETSSTDEEGYHAAEIMAQTMGFSSFGAPARPFKRRRVDDAVVASSQTISRGSVANTTPLGIRQPPSTGTAMAHRHQQPARVKFSAAARNADEIDLELDDEEETEVDGAASNAPSGTPAEASTAGPAASSCESGKGSSGGFHESPSRSHSQPWYVNYYDRKSNQNPWKKLEEKLGVAPQGAWPQL